VIEPHRLQAPRQHGAVVAEPPLSAVGSLLAANRDRLRAARGDLLGRPWQELRREARHAAVQAARTYLHHAGEPAPSFSSEALLLAGHQPELFHPGVWVKNFALHGLARAHGLTPVNLVVDNDTVKSAALRLPAVTVPLPPVSAAPPHLLAVPFDRPAQEVPYEERAVRNEALFASLPQRAQTSWNFVPLLGEFWTEVLRQAKRTPLLGERLAAARRTWERRWGCLNLELPVSALCRTEPFAWFACHLLSHLPRLHAIYNDSVHAYRRQYGIRSRHHPVPDLAADGDWREAPFWAWRSGQAQRGRLMVRPTGTALELRCGAEEWPALPRAVPEMVRAFCGLEARGFKVRSRALTNTLYARLFLADLFLHGIGGGKYDELTDALIRRFYGLEPPGYLVLSATLLLPLPTYPASAAECRRLKRELRELIWNPQRHLADGDAALQDLKKQKDAWVAQHPRERRQRWERYRALRALTEQLRVPLEGRIRETEARLAECERQLDANAILQRRDYAFCLYPEELLRPFCTQFLGGEGAPGM
jgi:hypothetical protein